MSAPHPFTTTEPVAPSTISNDEWAPIRTAMRRQCITGRPLARRLWIRHWLISHRNRRWN